LHNQARTATPRTVALTPS